MLFEQALSYLLSLGHETLTIKLGLTNTETLLDALGNPHQEFTAVQIAGTNGKGSTAVILDSICRAARIRTGLFTSPHLNSIIERIRVDGKQISEPDFARFTAQVKETAADLLERGRLETLPTFFEHITAIALLAFRDAKVELAILETGLGGRLDSTTAAGGEIVALTPIAMDHEEYLGDSLAEIAAEKAAIIRPGVAAIIAPQSDEALNVILRQCKASGVNPRIESSPVEIVETSSDGRCCVNFQTSEGKYDGVWIGLRGRHQATNALVAIGLAETLDKRGVPIAPEAILHGLATATHPGRLEIWEGHPRILFDGAHNPASARALRDYLDEFVPEPVTMIFGAMRDKALDEMSAALFPKAGTVILTEFDNPRAATIDSLKSAIPESFNRSQVRGASSIHQALGIARDLNREDGLICVTGSLYLVGAVQAALKQPSQSVAHQRA